MGLLVDEDKIVRKAVEQLMPLLMAVAFMPMLCVLMCTAVCCIRGGLKEKRERRLHAEKMRQLQRTGRRDDNNKTE